MKPESFVRVVAGVMILLSVGLAHFFSSWWLLLTVFVGVNLIQSAFTGFCPPEIVFRKLGFAKDADSSCRRGPDEARS